MQPKGEANPQQRQDGQTRRPAAFLDRDGIINVDHGYVVSPNQLELTPTAAEGIRLLNEAGYPVLVVSNQSGVARGYFDTADVDRFHGHLQMRLAHERARIDAFYYCPYHPDGSVESYAIDHEDRKPGSGMLRRAIADWSIRLEGSFLVGDRDSDMAAAAGAGVRGILVPSNVCDLAATVRAALAALS